MAIALLFASVLSGLTGAALAGLIGLELMMGALSYVASGMIGALGIMLLVFIRHLTDTQQT